MPRVGRYRTRKTTFRGSTALYNTDGSLNSGPFQVTSEHTSTCSDSKGRPVVPSSFNSVQYIGTMRLNGRALNKANALIYEYNDVPFFQGTGEVPNTSLLPVKNGWQLDLIAGTNPSRPVITPPSVIQDIITLPRLLKETGSLIRKPKKLMSAKEAANAHLAARFGWAPMIEDLIKVIGLQKTILKRVKELNNLYSGTGLKRRLKFANDTATTKQVSTRAMYGGGSISVDVHTVVRKDQWGTITWKPTAPPPFHPDDESKNRFAMKLALGLTVEGMAKGGWDVIPWTWLLGWFTNIGKYTLYYSNTVPATHSGACLMNRVVRTSFPGLVKVVGSDVYMLEPSGTYVTAWRNRQIGSGPVLPGLNMPFLDMSRLSVLASLFVQRMR